MMESISIDLSMLMLYQAIVCVVAIQGCKIGGIITFRDFKTEEAKKCKALSQSSHIFLPLLTLSRVSHLSPPRWHDLHLDQSLEIPLHSRVHHL